MESDSYKCRIEQDKIRQKTESYKGFYTDLISSADRINPVYTSEIIFKQLEARAFIGAGDEISKKTYGC